MTKREALAALLGFKLTPEEWQTYIRPAVSDWYAGNAMTEEFLAKHQRTEALLSEAVALLKDLDADPGIVCEWYDNRRNDPRSGSPVAAFLAKVEKAGEQ